MPESKVLFTSDGIIDLDRKVDRTRVELRPGLMEWFYQAGLFFKSQGIGMHCAKCGADILGKNADSDKTFSVTCGCREWIGVNRDYVEPRRH